MGAYLLDWFNLFFRWFHVIAGVAWIGASFYFVWLDMSLEKPPKWKQDKGISGDLWAVHGGGFYEVAKYKLEPEEMPKKLHWFKWEAYTTWLTGMCMLSIVYYFNAQSFLIDASKVPFTTVGAISTSLLFLFGSYFVYEVIVRSRWGKNAFIFSTTIFILLVIACWGVFQLFSGRAAYIHIGALLGTIMAGNVFFGIMPAQRALVDCVQRGEKPGKKVAEMALQAKNRSLMNNYFTLPLIFIMISNHYPMTYSSEYGWQILVYIGIVTAMTRHYFNQKHLGHKKPKYLIIPAILTILLIILMRPQPTKAVQVKAEPASQTIKSSAKTQPPNVGNVNVAHDAVVVSDVPVDTASDSDDLLNPDEHMITIVHERCTVCHATKPTQPGFNAPPLGAVFETVEQVRQYKDKILPMVQTKYMPLGNITQMTDEERQELISWLNNQ